MMDVSSKVVESECMSCSRMTNYRYLKCSSFVCNRSLDCSIFVDESYPGWKAGKCVALCKNCDSTEVYATSDEEDKDMDIPEENDSKVDGDDGRKQSVIKCASPGFYQYRKFWKPKLGQTLQIMCESKNVHDPYAMTLVVKSKRKITGSCVAGHLPREISRFCTFYLDYGGKLESTVVCTSFRRSPIPQGGLKMPINLKILQSDAPDRVFNIMKEKVETYYTDIIHTDKDFSDIEL